MSRDHDLLRWGWRAPTPTTLYTLTLFAFIAISRWPLASRYLYYFDSANFALAMESFNPALHQPQPPGYPLFVALTRIIHIWIASPAKVMLLAGLLAACGATFLLFLLVQRMFGRTVAILASALLASDPVFWFGGITNEIRLFLALSTAGVSLLAWRALTRPADPRALYLAFAVLGIVAGFRPVESTLLMPLLIWVWWRTSGRRAHLAWAMSCLGGCALPWFAAIIWSVGGFRGFAEMIWAYANDQFNGSCLFFGATLTAASRMFTKAVAWNFLGTASWVWALPFCRQQPFHAGERLKRVFLALWFFPPFLFSAVIHIGDPDQALASVPVLCIAGGVVLARFLKRAGADRVFTAATAVMLSHALLFFFPPTKLAWAASYPGMMAVTRMTTGALTSIQFLRRGKPVTIVHFGSSVAYRQLEYYFPDDYLVVLPGDPKQPEPGETILAYHRHQAVPLPQGPTGVLQPASRRVICLAPFRTKLSALPGWQAYGPVFYKDIDGVPSLTIGPYTLIRP